MAKRKRLTFLEYIEEHDITNSSLVTEKDVNISVRKPVYIVWDNFNPPTKEHRDVLAKLSSLAKEDSNAPFFVYPSQSDHPVSFNNKIFFLKKMFPRYNKNILSHRFQTPFDVMADLFKKEYTEVNVVTTHDREYELRELLVTNNNNGGIDGVPHYSFDKINIIPISIDDRVVDVSILENHTLNNNFEMFYEEFQGFISERITRDLFDVMRESIVDESITTPATPATPPPAKIKDEKSIRDKFIDGELFNVSDIVIIEKTQERGTIEKLGTNYVTVILENNSKKRVWIKDISLV